MKNLIKRIFAVCAAIAMCFTVYITNITAAAEGASDLSALTTSYDNTSIVDDLEDLNIDLYPAIPGGKGKVIRFSEYCYTEKALLKDYYGLYFYVYNPSEEPIYEYGNTVNIATKYDEQGKPISYENVSLTLLDDTSGVEKFKNRFFKFKIKDEEKRKAFYEMANSYALAHGGDRRYDIAGVQLFYKDGNKVEDLSYAKTYYMSGTAKGFGKEEESTLSARSSTLETIELEVEHTYYRTGDYQDYVCDELNTVYFSVPQEYFDKYGALQKIKAEWYEYKTNPVFVTSNEKAYDGLKSYIGKDIGGNRYDELPWRVLWEETFEWIGDHGNNGATGTIWNKGFNPYTDGDMGYGLDFWVTAGNEGNYLTRFDWLFKLSEVKSIDDYNVTSDEVIAYMERYTADHSDQARVGRSQLYAEGLFADSIDEDRLKLLEDENKSDKRGHIVEEIDAGDMESLTVKKDNSWWYEFWHGIEYGEGEEFTPIEILSKEDLSGLSATDFGEQYYVNENDAETVKNYCSKALNNGSVPVLFRFAKTDYYASQAAFDKDGDWAVDKNNGYVAQETVFLDFDIIELTFRSEIEGDTVIPVVADPIDIINGLDAPPSTSTDSLWDKLMALWNNVKGKIYLGFIIIIAVIALVIILNLLSPWLPYILKGVGWLLLLPFKLLWWLLKGIWKGLSKLFSRRNNENEYDE